METLTKNVETAESPSREIGGVIVGRIIEIVPVPYGGDEKTTYVIQEPIDRFMVEKPA